VPKTKCKFTVALRNEFKYLAKWSKSLDGMEIFQWMKLKRIPNFEQEVEPSLNYARELIKAEGRLGLCLGLGLGLKSCFCGLGLVCVSARLGFAVLVSIRSRLVWDEKCERDRDF
jgi:hypothetical protein